MPRLTDTGLPGSLSGLSKDEPSLTDMLLAGEAQLPSTKWQDVTPPVSPTATPKPVDTTTDPAAKVAQEVKTSPSFMGPAQGALNRDIAKETPEVDDTIRKQFEEDLKGLNAVWREEKERLQRGELAEKFSNAISQLAAGWYGSKHGVDLSGLKFDKTDWDKRYALALSELNTGMAGQERVAALAEKAKDRADRAARDKQDMLYKAAALEEKRLSDQADNAKNLLLIEFKKSVDAAKEDKEAQKALNQKIAQVNSDIDKEFQRSKNKPDPDILTNAVATSLFGVSESDPEEKRLAAKKAAEEIVSTPGSWWGRNVKGAADIKARIRDYMTSTAAAAPTDTTKALPPPPSPGGKTIVKQAKNAQGKTWYLYSDGSSEIK